MTNKSEQDGDSSKTIEISDMKYHIFQVCASVLCSSGRGCLPPQPTLVHLDLGIAVSWPCSSTVPSALVSVSRSSEPVSWVLSLKLPIR